MPKMFDNVTLPCRKNMSSASTQLQPLVNISSEFDPLAMKTNNNGSVGVVLGDDKPVLDQIIDLNYENSGSITVNKNNLNLNSTETSGGVNEENSVIGAPIIAFEESITASTKSDVPSTAGNSLVVL